MANFFELLGLSSDELADANPELIVETYHTEGKEGVRRLMYGLVAERLGRPIWVHPDHLSNQAEVYGENQPGGPLSLIRDRKDLYRRHNDSFRPQLQPLGSAPSSAGRPPPAPGSGGGGPKASKRNTSGSAAAQAQAENWEKRFVELQKFVDTHGYRPRRQGAEISEFERRLHYWMGQNQRKLNKGELPMDRAERLADVLRVKGKGPPSSSGGGKATSSRGQAAGGEGEQAEEAEEEEEEQEQYMDSFENEAGEGGDPPGSLEAGALGA